MKSVLGLLMATVMTTTIAMASETVMGVGTRVGQRSATGSSPAATGEANFAQEITCGSALAASNLVGTHGFQVVPGKGILFAGLRAERAGFYTFGPKGAAFSELGTTKPVSENYRLKTFNVQVQFPGAKEKTALVYKQLISNLGDAGLEVKEAGSGEVLNAEEAGDLFAEKALLTRLNESIASMPKNTSDPGSPMFPNLVKLQKEKTRESLSKVICACKGVEGTKEAIAKMRASREVKVYEVKFPCE